ncbi:MAG: hypothetical protein WC765_05850 [Phycisphaerae bacterium]
MMIPKSLGPEAPGKLGVVFSSARTDPATRIELSGGSAGVMGCAEAGRVFAKGSSATVRRKQRELWNAARRP